MAVTGAKSTTVRLSTATHARLKQIAAQTNEPITQVLDRAVEHEARRLFWKTFHESGDRLQADAEAWAAYQTESKELEGTLLDGLDPDEGEEWDESLADAATW